MTTGTPNVPFAFSLFMETEVLSINKDIERVFVKNTTLTHSEDNKWDKIEIPFRNIGDNILKDLKLGDIVLLKIGVKEIVKK